MYWFQAFNWQTNSAKIQKPCRTLFTTASILTKLYLLFYFASYSYIFFALFTMLKPWRMCSVTLLCFLCLVDPIISSHMIFNFTDYYFFKNYKIVKLRIQNFASKLCKNDSIEKIIWSNFLYKSQPWDKLEHTFIGIAKTFFVL